MMHTANLRQSWALPMFVLLLFSGIIRAEDMNLTGNMTVNGASTLNGNMK